MDNVVMPIFIITCDRLEALKTSMQSYLDCIKTSFKIIIIDMGSTFGPTIEFIKDLEHKGIIVYWHRRIETADDFNEINNHIQDYFSHYPQSNYIITDPDIALDNAEGDILMVYAFLLETIPTAHVIGPMLRIDNIPDYYPWKRDLLNGTRGGHQKFHSLKREIINYQGKQIVFIRAHIDTTFGMYRAGTHWQHFRWGLRTFAPYSARHLDWYVDPQNQTPDQAHYMNNCSRRISHWSYWGQG